MSKQVITNVGAFTTDSKDKINSNFDDLYDNKGAPVVTFFDDFLGDVIADQWIGLVGSDAQCVTPTINSSTTTGINGVVRLTAGDDAAATMAVNGCQISTNRQFTAGNGGLVAEFRVLLSSVSSVAVFVGFTDVSTLEMPANSSGSGDGITTNATDAVGFMFDTAMTTDNWWAVGVKNDTDATAQNTGIAPVVNVAQILRIEVDANERATFYINGAKVGAEMLGAVTNTVALTPTVAVFSRTTATKLVDVDYISARKNRS